MVKSLFQTVALSLSNETIHQVPSHLKDQIETLRGERRTEDLRNLFIRGNHSVMQHVWLIPPSLRGNLDYVFLFNKNL